MDVLILCGGLGTRLRPVVGDRPKSMALIGGRPFLEWQLVHLASLGFTRVILCIGYQGHVIREYFLDGRRFGLDIQYSEETDLLGTGGAISRAVPCIQSDPVLILNGDSWCEVEIPGLVHWHDTKNAHGTLVLTQVSDPRRFGRVEVDDEGTIHLMQEKGNVSGTGWINAGIYVLSRQFIEAIPNNRPVSLERDVFPTWVGRGLYGYRGGKKFLDIGLPHSYAQAEAFFADCVSPVLHHQH